MSVFVKCNYHFFMHVWVSPNTSRAIWFHFLTDGEQSVLIVEIQLLENSRSLGSNGLSTLAPVIALEINYDSISYLKLVRSILNEYPVLDIVKSIASQVHDNVLQEFLGVAMYFENLLNCDFVIPVRL